MSEKKSCGCGKRKQAEAEAKAKADAEANNVAIVVKEEDAVLLDESVLSKLNDKKSNLPQTHIGCQLYINDYVTDLVTFKLYNSNGDLLHESSVSRYEPVETFVNIVTNYEKVSKYVFPNKEGIASQISAHVYVHKEVKKAIDLYSSKKIDLTKFQALIQNATQITYENSSGLRNEFELTKKLFKK